MKKRNQPHRRAVHLRHPAHKPQKRSEGKAIVGVFCSTRRGFGFVTPEEGGEDVFIPAEKVNGAWHGDTVRVLLKNSYDGRNEGRIESVLAKQTETVIGTLISERVRGSRDRRRVYFCLPDNKALPEYLPVEDIPDLPDGDKIECRIVRGKHPYGVFLRSFGGAWSLAANRDAILAENGIETEFDSKAVSEAKERAALPLSEEGRERIPSPALTIDGADAKDLDDAVSLQKTENGYRLGVHIADVSEYVLPRTALDRTAMQRGTSVYFADRVIPMLPESLSNGACSLNAGEDKYTLSAEIDLDRSGGIASVRLFRGILKSDVRGVYSEVNDLLAQGDASPFAEKYQKVRAMLEEMQELYLLLEKRAALRGAPDFDTPEPYFRLDENERVTAIERRERGVSERMIEQFMITANEAVATLLAQKELPCVFRIHEAPPPEKKAALARTVSALGLSTLPLQEEPLTARAFAALLKEAEEKGKAQALSYPLVRAMAKASYSEFSHPHFGLGISHYCHFTSPIRRLSDLATHRMIKAVLLDGEVPERYKGYARRAAAAASERELCALSTEREMDALYCALWAQDHLGECFDATVSGVTAFGVFATLENTAEGLIPIEDLPFGSFYDEDNAAMRIGAQSLTPADPIRIRIEDASLSARRIRFSLLTE